MAVGISPTGTVKTGIVFTGQHKMAARMKVLERGMPLLWSEALLEEGKAVLKDAQDNFVPIETELLKNSGEIIITPFKRGAPAYFVDVQFGGTPSTEPYAIAIHEHPSTASPPTWQGVEINWSKPGTGPKYLEKPIRAARAKMPITVAARVTSRMPLIPGAFTTSTK